MTRFIHSVLPKRNPRNVPLDIFDTGGSLPFPEPLDQAGLNYDQRMFQANANRLHRERLLDTYRDRRAAAREQYIGILSEIVRGIAEAAHRIQGSGLLQGSMEPAGWTRLGQYLASMFRDAAAAVFIVDILESDLFEPQKSHKLQIGKKSRVAVSAAQLREMTEERASIVEKWIVARAAFEGRREIIAARALHPTKGSQHARDAIQKLDTAVTKLQAGIASGSFSPKSLGTSKVYDYVQDVYTATKDTLQVLNDPDLNAVSADLLRPPVRTLQAGLKKTEKLAAKGEPGPSRKLSREAAIREGDEPKRNPFAGFRNFAACVRAKSKDPRNYSPAGLCATIERKGHKNPAALTTFGAALLSR